MEPDASQRRQVTTGRADPRQRAFRLCGSTVEPPPNQAHHGWVKNQLKVLRREVHAMSYTRSQLLQNSTFREWLTGVLKAADTGISRVLAKESKVRKDHLRFPSEIPDDVRNYLT